MALDMFELGEQPYSTADEEWDDFVRRHRCGSLLQTAVWARLKNRFGWQSHRVTVRKDGVLVAGTQFLYRSYAFGMVRIGYTPHGPLVDWQDAELVALLFNQLDTAAWQNRVAMTKIEPLIWADDSEVTPERWAELCHTNGCVIPTDSIQPPRTVRIDIRPDEEAILAGMKQKTRYNIRLGPKKGVTVRRGTRHDIPTFNRLMVQTGQRNEFGVHDPKYYSVAFEEFDQYLPGSVGLFLAESEGETLAAVMAFAFGGQGSYLYGASSDLQREKMASYAVQWEALRWAKGQGCQYYDMWGVPDYDQDYLEANFKENREGLWGVYRFKRGWGGDLVRTVGPADRVYNKLTYRLYKRRRG